MLVFLYGTLKTGEANHNLLLLKGQCSLKGKGITVEKYPLVVATRYNGPFLLYKPGIGNVRMYRLCTYSTHHADAHDFMI